MKRIFHLARKYWAYLFGLSLIANLVLAGVLIFRLVSSGGSGSGLYPFLSKRIFAENQNDILVNFIPLRNAMNEHIGKMGGAVGAYFEYLPSGTSIGVNDKKELKLASLIKVPIVMAVYKQIYRGKLSKQDALVVKAENFDSSYGNLWKRGEGTTLTVEEAIRLALTESDNTAANVLYSALLSDALDEVFDNLDIPKDKESDYPTLSPKNYTSILRSLYLSSFLPEEFSNEILQILTETIFTDKLPAGVPADVKVAHKVGVFRPQGSIAETQVFSDCGIFYVPNRPYALCVMVTGSEGQAREYIKFISKMVYGYVIKVND